MRAHHRRVDRGRRHRVHQHLVGGAFHRHDLGERDDGRLGRGVGAAVDLVADAGDRGQEDDAGELALGAGELQERHGFASGEPQTAHVDRKKLVEVLYRHGIEGADPEHARRAHEAVEAAEPPADVGKGTRDAFHRGHIARLHVQAIRGSGEVLAQRSEPSLVAIERHDRPALIEQALRRAPSDARCCSSDGRDFGHDRLSTREVVSEW